eukprot:CAMPEP_0181090480 /NCGR_PEP_ID=MMETSP1071-20121207/7881_1 /TAXON_ID=35127 /ORGANISM="Thalassiosira sp., Strain NH16" /LENGTH=814 /DNA_ID=CAMNT_0023172543 /DNA_START=279 /DNA_END=2724 /DNA_ORIENTATION=+
MTGGYYKRLAAEANKPHSKNQHRGSTAIRGSASQLGGTSEGYILGIYDTKIQHIANSTTMQTVSSSLAIALHDFESSHLRSLLGLGFGPKGEMKGSRTAEFSHQSEVPSPRHQTLGSFPYRISGRCLRGEDDSTVEEDCGDENASTSSNTALARLQFVVTSIFGLREAARIRRNVDFESHASRLFMISTGTNVTGDGLGGCSRETLEFLCSYSPDAAYTLDMETIYSSLKNNDQGKDVIGGVIMVQSLAAASKGYALASNRSRFRRHVAAAMSINPQATGEENAVPSFRNEYQNILRLNSFSYVLYVANYYTAVPTAHLFSNSLGSRSSSAALIGIANISSHCVQSICANWEHLIFLFSSKHVTWDGIDWAFLIGFGSAEILNITLLPVILPQESINAEVASLAKLSMVTIPFSLILGSLVDIKAKRPNNMLPQLAEQILSTMPSMTPVKNITLMTISDDQPFLPPLPLDPPSIFDQSSLFSLESVGYVMAFAWFVQMIGLIIFFFDAPKSKKREGHKTDNPNELKILTTQEEDFDSDNDAYEKPAETDLFLSVEEDGHNGTFEKLQTMSRKTVRGGGRGEGGEGYIESLANIRSLVFKNVAFPTTTAILFIAKAATEALLSSCGTITSRCFNWSGAKAGLFIGCLTAMILPINLSLASRNDTERGIIKAALETARNGLLLMLNYESLVFIIITIIEGGQKKTSTSYYYDGMFGLPQYTCSFVIVFSSIVTLESAGLTLMSRVQVNPRQMKKYTVDNAFIVAFVSAVARLVGDILIFTFDSLHMNDIVNPICISLMIAVTAGIYIARKHYFFLI